MAPKRTTRTTKRRSTAKQARAGRSARALHAIISQLAEGRSEKAVRLFMDADAHNLLPKGPKLPRWIEQAVGRDVVVKLTEAWATFPCFYCKKGVETCLRCGGVGSTSAQALCEECLGHGLTRCDCCGGSGWITINCVPVGLRSTVLLARASLARHGLKALLDKPLPRPVPRNPSAVLKRCTQQLLAINRILGVFENTVVALKDAQTARGIPKPKTAALLKLCVECGIAGEARMRELLSTISAAARMEAKLPGADEDARQLSLQWAEQYERLAGLKSFTDTMLGHPFLLRVVKKAAAKRTAATKERQAAKKPTDSPARKRRNNRE